MLTIIIVILADLIGFSLLVPIYALLKDYYNISDLQVGYFVQIWAASLCLGGIFFGVLSDKTSRKTGLLIPIIGSILTYLLAFFMDSYPLLLMCRAFNGFFNGNFVVAMATAADISTDETRLKNMSAVGATLALSWILGPMAGGFISSLAKTPYQMIHLPFLASAAFSLLAFIFVITLFPKSIKTAGEKREEKESVLKEFFQNLMNKQVLFYAFLNVLFMMIITGCQIYFGIWVTQRFNLSVANVGMAWGIFGVAAFCGQLTINKFLFKTNAQTLISAGFLGMGLSFILWAFSKNLHAVYIGGIALYYASAFVSSGINTRVSLSGQSDAMGMVFGINQTFSGIGRVISSSFVGTMVTYIGYNYSWIACGGIFIATAILCAVLFAGRYLEKS